MHGTALPKWLLCGLPILLLTATLAQEPTPGPNQTPEQIDAMTFRWLREYVGYIITDPERDAFLSLDTPQQRLAFIEQFWKRRDPTPGTPKNEAREEHMRRFSYANKQFQCGKPGWKTDRGRVYIMLGPPQHREMNPMGRESGERPSEVWSYNGVKSRTLPASFDLSFVDFNGTGDFQIVSNLELAAPIKTYAGYIDNPLDLLSRAVNADALADPSEFRSRSQTFDLGDLERANFDLQRDLQAIQESAQTADLPKSEVQTHIQFASFPMQLSTAYFRAGRGRSRAQISFSLDFSTMESKNYQKLQYFHVELLSRLLRGGPDGTIVDELREDLPFQVPERELAEASRTPIVYQLNHYAVPGPYTLELLVRDAVGSRVSVTRQEIDLPAFPSEGLGISTPLLCESIRKADGQAQGATSFRQGDLVLLPRVSGSFHAKEALQVYLQVYGARRDEGGTHHLQIDYRVWSSSGGLALRAAPQASEGKVLGTIALYTSLPLLQLQPGRYELEAIVLDKQSEQRVQRRVPFQIQ
jgi:GWxTD domain-containing protein